MKARKITAAFLAVITLLTVLSSCSLISIRRSTPETSVYVNSDYHFSLRKPYAFSEVEEIPSEENGDEFTIVLSNGDEDKITVEITYKPEGLDTLFDLASELQNDRIIPVSKDCFAYDGRVGNNGKVSEYLIYAMTKRMLYTVRYTADNSDESSLKACDLLYFEFDMYANVPKENQFLSKETAIADGAMSVRVPGNSTASFFPEPVPVYDEDGLLSGYDTSACGKIKITADNYFLSADVGKTEPLALNDLMPQTFSEKAFDRIDTSYISGLENVSALGQCRYRTNGASYYGIMYYTCTYNGKNASGAFTAGYTLSGKYFEYNYAVYDDCTTAERDNYECMLSSLDAK